MSESLKERTRRLGQNLNRRQFVGITAAVPFMTMRHTQTSQSPLLGGLTDISGVKVGHYTDARRPTGCTVVLLEKGAVAAVDVRGSAPGTRETDLLDPVNTVNQIHAILLSGGSAFGLEAAGGVVRYLEEKGIGYQTSVARVPIVPAAILFDLGLGDSSIRPDADAGYKACQAAHSGSVEEGCVGAGAGATVGKMYGLSRAMKSGIGTASLRVGQVRIGALAAVNCVGDVLDPSTGQLLAGLRDESGQSLANSMQVLKEDAGGIRRQPAENTTLAVVATNARFTKTEMTKIAQMSQDGFARAINPVHLPFDGDTAFAISTSEVEADLGQVGALAADVTARAILRAVQTATGLPDLPAARDLGK